MTAYSSVWCAFSVALGLALTGCSRSESPPRSAGAPRTVVLVTLDTFRADRLAAYGHAPGLTPNLDALAARGTHFERCLAVAPITLPAHASILTGVDPIAHGLRVNGVGTLPSDVPVLPESLRGAGFRTGAFVSSAVLDRRHLLTRGFDTYDDFMAEDDDDSPLERTGERTVAAALRFTAANAGKDVFLWVHLFDAHAPYVPHPDLKHNATIPYDGEIAYVDHCVGLLVEGLTQAGRSDPLYCVVSDHGEGLGEHGESTHTVFVYDTTIHVPWLMAGPGIPAGKAVPGTVSTISLAPTLLALLNIERPVAMYGQSLAAAIAGDAKVADDGVRFESKATEFYYGFAPLSGFEREQTKLIVAPRSELYHPLDDPRELSNRFDAERSVADARKRELDAYERQRGSRHADPPPLDDHHRAMLVQMGYIATSGQRTADDPKDGIERVEGLARAQLRAYDDPIGARQDLFEFVKKYPNIAEARELLGDYQLQTGMLEDAIRSFEQAIQLRPRDPGLFVKLGQSRLFRNDTQGAKEAFEVARTIDVNHVDATVWLARISLANDPKEARRLAEAVLKSNPESVEALAVLSAAALALGDRAAALDAAKRALAAKPRDLGVLRMLGSVLAQCGDRTSACAALKRALSICRERSKGQANPQCDALDAECRAAGCG